MSTSIDLWRDALDSLATEDRQHIDFDCPDKRAVLDEILAEVLRARTESHQGKWCLKFKNKKIILRDILEKLVKAVQTCIAIGDVAIQVDPIHAALPWAAIRFLLQLSVNDTATRGAIFIGVEQIARVVTRCSIIERLYLVSPRNNVTDQLAGALIQLYAAILCYLAHAKKHFERSATQRLAGSLLPVAARSFESLSVQIEAKEEEVIKISKLADTDNVQNTFRQEQTALENIRETVRDIRTTSHEQSRQIQEAFSEQNDRTNEAFSALLRKLEQPLFRLATDTSNLSRISDHAERLAVLRWICTTSYRDNFNMEIEGIMPDSGDWLFQRKEFIEWRASSSASVLWLHGIPGCGKSKLIARVIERLSEELNDSAEAEIVPLAFFFCARNTSEPLRSEPAEVIKAILKQLGTSRNAIHETIKEAYATSKDKSDLDGSPMCPLSIQEATNLTVSVVNDNQQSSSLMHWMNAKQKPDINF